MSPDPFSAFSLEESITLSRCQTMKDFTSRRHHPGLHEIDLLINGEVFARGKFTLNS